jgi:hypothetical protein
LCLSGGGKPGTGEAITEGDDLLKEIVIGLLGSLCELDFAD